MLNSFILLLHIWHFKLIQSFVLVNTFTKHSYQKLQTVHKCWHGFWREVMTGLCWSELVPAAQMKTRIFLSWVPGDFKMAASKASADEKWSFIVWTPKYTAVSPTGKLKREQGNEQSDPGVGGWDEPAWQHRVNRVLPLKPGQLFHTGWTMPIRGESGWTKGSRWSGSGSVAVTVCRVTCEQGPELGGEEARTALQGMCLTTGPPLCQEGPRPKKLKSLRRCGIFFLHVTICI